LKGNRDATLFNLLGVCLCELKDFLNAEKALE
jgi:Flp pilus assembly protein TadD